MLVIGLLTVGLVAGAGNAKEIKPKEVKSQPSPVVKENYTTHAPIWITNDSNFDSKFPERTISDFKIDGSSSIGTTGNSSCIFIENCKEPFTIQNCLLSQNYDSVNDQSTRIGIGIHLINSSNCLIRENIYSHNKIANYWNAENIGIYLEGCTNCSVINNTCSYNRAECGESGASCSGILLSDSKNNIILSNLCTCDFANAPMGCDAIGITLEKCRVNTIKNNIFDGMYGGMRCGYGFIISVSYYNIITLNNITNNDNYGFYITDSKYNTIHHNNIINNLGTQVKQVYDSGNNFWNTSTEGNYWSDWKTPDDNHDGIVGSPYVLDGNGGAKDFFPLVHPVQIAGPNIPEPSPLPLVLLSVVLLTALVSRHRWW